MNRCLNLTFFPNINFQKSNRLSLFLKFLFNLFSEEGIGVDKEDFTPLAYDFSDKSKPNSTCSTGDKNGFIFHLLEILGFALRSYIFKGKLLFQFLQIHHKRMQFSGYSAHRSSAPAGLNLHVSPVENRLVLCCTIPDG